MFDTLPKPQADYMLGWLACDGSLEGNRITVSLQLQARDRVVLELFRRFVGGKFDKNDRVINGRRYSRVRVHDKELWTKLAGYFWRHQKGRKRFPLFASDEFILGCLDADGCFYQKGNSIEGEFQHESHAFRRGLKTWLEQKGVPFWVRIDRNTICFPPTACRMFAALYPKTVGFGLRRKAEVLFDWPKPSDKYWTESELELLRAEYAVSGPTKLSKRLDRSAKSIQLKAWRCGYGPKRVPNQTVSA